MTRSEFFQKAMLALLASLPAWAFVVLAFWLSVKVIL